MISDDTQPAPAIDVGALKRANNSRACRSWYERNRAYVLKMRKDRYESDPEYRRMQNDKSSVKAAKRNARNAIKPSSVRAVE